MTISSDIKEFGYIILKTDIFAAVGNGVRSGPAVAFFGEVGDVNAVFVDEVGGAGKKNACDNDNCEFFICEDSFACKFSFAVITL